MANISTFPTITDIMRQGTNIQTFIAGGTISAGQVVGFQKTGTNLTVVAMTGCEPLYGAILGVAIEGASSGEVLSVALDGCVARVANASDSVAIDAGSFLEVDGNSVGGTVHGWEPYWSMTSFIPATGADGITDHRVGTQNRKIIGIALEDIAGNGTGLCLIRAQTLIEPLIDRASYYGTNIT